MKTCSKCKETKELNLFHNLKSSKDGKKSTCKECIKKDAENYYSNNKEAILSRIDKDKAKEKSKEYYAKNKDSVLDKMADYYLDNEDAIKERSKEYYSKNKDKIQARQTKQKRERRQADSMFRTADNLRKRIREAMQNKGFKKANRTLEILGIEYEGLINHIESKLTEGMTLDKLGKEIHIDHIIPLDSATTEEKLIKLCHYTNLQPLWAEDNLKKSNKILK